MGKSQYLDKNRRKSIENRVNKILNLSRRPCVIFCILTCVYILLFIRIDVYNHRRNPFSGYVLRMKVHSNCSFENYRYRILSVRLFSNDFRPTYLIVPVTTNTVRARSNGIQRIRPDGRKNSS